MVLEMKGGWVEKGGEILLFLLTFPISFLFLFFLVYIYMFIYTYFFVFFCFVLFFVWLASTMLRNVVQESFEVRDIIKDGGEG